MKFQFSDPLTIAQPLPTTSKKRGRQEIGSEGGQEAKKVKKRVERFKHKQSKEDIFKKMQQSFAGEDPESHMPIPNLIEIATIVRSLLLLLLRLLLAKEVLTYF